MKTKPFTELLAKVEKDPERRQRIGDYKRAIDDAIALSELRAQRGATQREVAERLEVTQANVSRIEHEEDIYLSTLRGYVAALGGQLQITAVFPDSTVTLVPAEH